MTFRLYPFRRGLCGEGIGLPLFMKVYIMENLTWGKNAVELEKNAQQRVDFLRVLSRNDMPQKLLVVLLLLTESTLTYSLCGFGPPAAGLSRGKRSRGS